MTSSRTAVIAVAALGFVLAAAALFILRPSSQSDAERWSSEACKATTEWIADRDKDPGDLVNELRTSSGPEEARTIALAYVDRVIARSARLTAALAAPGGPVLPAKTREELTEYTGKLAKAKETIAAASTTNLAEFAAVLSEVIDDAGKAEGMQAAAACPSKI